MNELDICKRIAEIEGNDFYLLESGEDFYPMIKIWSDSVFKDKCVPKKFFEAHDYNPLTDDALCFRLMVKYKINIYVASNVKDSPWTADLWKEESIYRCRNESPNKAICLAIIEANKD